MITSSDPKYIGRAWAEVAPRWAYSQKFKMSDSDIDGCAAVMDKIIKANVRLGGERVSSYYTRVASNQTLDGRTHCMKFSAQSAANGNDGAAAGGASAAEDFSSLPAEHTIDGDEMSKWKSGN